MMITDTILTQLTEGTILEGPHWTEPVKVLTAKARGSRIEVQAVGIHTRRLWTKLLKPEEFDGAIKVTSADALAALDGNPTHFRLAAEAHKMAAYRYGTKVNKTQRYELGEFLREHTDHYVFLTATPHKGDPDNFALLLQLLDQDLYVTGHILAEASAHDENRIMVRRLKEDMKKFDGSPCFPPRHVQTLSYKLSPQELTLYNAVTDYVAKRSPTR